jgi:hypothetical protein
VINALPIGSHWAISQFDSTDNGLCIAQAIRNDIAVAVIYGSFKHKFGTSALIIKATNQEDSIIAVNAVPGHPNGQSSYRSKLAGIFDQVIMVNCT